MSVFKTNLQLFEDAILAGEPVAFYGPPGVGKSAFVNEFGRKRGWLVKTLIGSALNPTDISGYPQPDIEKMIMRFLAPSFVEELNAAKNGAILFVDETNRATPMVQNVLLRVIWDGVVGDVPLEKHVRVIGAYNPEGFGVQPMDEALANRFVHIEFNPTVDDWWEIYGSKQKSYGLGLVYQFLRRYSDLAVKLPEDEEKAWPSLRSWTSVGFFIDRTKNSKMDTKDYLFLGVKNRVGNVAASQFIPFYDELQSKLPSPADVLANPEGCSIPQKSDGIKAVCDSIYSYLCQHENEEGFESLLKSAWIFAYRAAEVCFPAAFVLAFRRMFPKWANKWLPNTKTNYYYIIEYFQERLYEHQDEVKEYEEEIKDEENDQ